ncbi:hypothetical protein EST38_g4517 [Candolleomyces aberdarensis]|uniref:Fungal-type protein kinase domain-containing protein n=1 Tax=Candolleomyces aberdarensis TaxID=2316362 RepID=A0A4Q2DME4_9AGAR|nr:hypothetical protein EST38_g4517 [Candolleomyces aberdarensis]
MSSSPQVKADRDREAQPPLDGPELSPKDEMIHQQLAMLDAQLKGNVSLAEEQFTNSLYHELVSDERVEAFLASCDLYDSKTERWLNIPKAEEISEKSDLYKPVLEIIDNIIKGLSDGADRTRQIKETHDVRLLHLEESEMDHYSSPSLAIRARGPSFELPRLTKNGSSTSIGFSNVTACFDVVRSEDAHDGLSQLGQQAVYARQIFIQQPNRTFVRSLVITEHYFHFYHFDRAGAQFVSYIDYHSSPDAFVRIVIGLSSDDEEVLGLDTSVQWIIEDGRKTGGSVTVIDDKTNVRKTYSMVDIKPCFTRFTLSGRGTVCWVVWDSENERDLFIKDAWIPSWRPDPEHELLETALGLEGVVQMVACEGNRCETKDFRAAPEDCWQPPDTSRSRRYVRIVEECCGEDILNFGSEMELLCAHQ